MQQNSDVAFIFKRSFLGFFWGIIFLPLFVGYFFLKVVSPDALAAHNIGVGNPYVMGGIIFYMIITALYSFVVGHVKHMEQVIRLMSDIKEKKMLSAQSLLLSKKIFKDSVKFKIALFLKYYWFVSVVYLFVFVGALYQFVYAPFYQKVVALVFAGVVALIGWMYVHFFLAAKTRFGYFIFLSHFGELLPTHELFNEMKKLSVADSNDDGIAMMGYLKRDTAVDLGSVVTSSTVDSFGSRGLGSDIAKGYARGVAFDASEYSKLELDYNQYKTVYNKVYGKNPELNPGLMILV